MNSDPYYNYTNKSEENSQLLLASGSALVKQDKYAHKPTVYQISILIAEKQQNHVSCKLQ